MPRKSTQVALGGICSSLCVLLMFMTGLIPFATYAIPMLAGALLIPVVVENGAKTAALVYISVSVLSFFLVGDREAFLLFTALFGYYPILKRVLERLRPPPVSILVKLAIFNAAVILSYSATVYLFGMAGVMEDMGDLGRYGLLGLLAVGNVLFLLYDYLLTRYMNIYIKWFRPRFLRRV